ncbi:unnamed protein product, partial [Timema podura]|nr:unnamed protein product [Timema podura]
MELSWCPARKTNPRTNLSRDVCSSPPPTNGALKPGGSCWSSLANPRLVKHDVMSDVEWESEVSPGGELFYIKSNPVIETDRPPTHTPKVLEKTQSLTQSNIYSTRS